MVKISRFFSHGVLLSAGMLFQFIGSFFGRVVLGRGLGDANYGSFVVLLTTVNLLTAVLHFGFPQALAQRLPRAETNSEYKGLFVSATIISGGLTLLAVVLLNIYANDVVVLLGIPDQTVALRVLSLALPFVVFTKISTGVVQAQKNTIVHTITNKIIRPISLLILYSVAIHVGLDVTGAAVSYAFGFLITGSIIGYYLFDRVAAFSTDVSSTYQIRGITRFSLPLILSAFSYNIFADIDTILLSRMASSSATGQYRAAYPVAVTVTAALSAFSFLLLPHLSELDKNDSYQRLRDAYSMVSKWTLLVSFPISMVMILFPKEIMILTFGPEYVTAADVLPILAVGLGIHVVLGPNKDALTAIGRVDFIMLVMVFSALTNLGLNYLLIPTHGMVGAAVATTLTYLSLNIILSGRLYTLHRVTPFSKRAILSITFSSISVILLWSVTGHFLTNPITTIVVFSILFGTLHLIIVIRYGISPLEIDGIEAFSDNIPARTSYITLAIRKLNSG